MAVQSNLRNMVLVLGITCLLCSGILGGAYVLTKAPIDAAAAQKTERAVAQVLPFFKEVELQTIEADGTDYVCYRATEGETLVGHAIETSAVGFGGDLRLMVGITPDGVVYGTSVLSQAETPGLGAKCSSDERFIRQWQGFDPSVKKLAVAKDGGDVDAITASTITSRAYTQAVARAVNVWKVLNGGQSDAVSGASAVLPNTEGDIDYE